MSERPVFDVPTHGGIVKKPSLPEASDVIEDINSTTSPTHGGVVPPQDYYIKPE